MKKVKKNQKALFMLSFTAIALGISVFFTATFLVVIGELHQSNTHTLLQHIVELKSQKLESFIEEHKEIMSWIARDELVAAALVAHSEIEEEDAITIPHIAVVPHLTDDFAEVFITDASGEIIASTHEESVGIVIDSQYLDSHLGVSDVAYAEHLGEAVAYMPLDVDHSNTGNSLGFAVAAIPIEEIAEMIELNRAIGQTGEVYIVDNDHTLVTPARFVDGGGVLVQQIETIGERCEQEGVSSGSERAGILHLFADYRGEDVFAAHAPVPNTEWCIHAKIDASEIIAKPAQNHLSTAALITAGSLVFAGLGGYILGRRYEKEE